MTLLSVEHIDKSFHLPSGRVVHAVRDVSFSIAERETLAIIGESGSGKSTVGRCLLGLIPIDSGAIDLEGRGIASLSPRELRRIRSELTVVFQEPLESLNPRMRIASIVEEPLVIHRPHMSRVERQRKVASILDEVGLPSRVANRFPRELSGGQQQRVGIARALIVEPRLVVLDEPTSSLDLSVQGQILMLLSDLQKQRALSYLYISHDIGTVSYMAGRIAVMRDGEIVESGSTDDILRHPREPYTQALLASVLEVPN